MPPGVAAGLRCLPPPSGLALSVLAPAWRAEGGKPAGRLGKGSEAWLGLRARGRGRGRGRGKGKGSGGLAGSSPRAR